MKKFACVFFVLMLLAMAAVPAVAAEVEGMSVNANDKYYMSIRQFTLPLSEYLWVEGETDAAPETIADDTQTLESNIQSGDNVGASIGIIGGADGPTAILVSNIFVKRILGVLAVAAVAAAGIALGIIVGRKTKK